MLHVCYPKKRGDWNTIHKENDVIKTQEELASAKKQLKQSLDISLEEIQRDTCQIFKGFRDISQNVSSPSRDLDIYSLSYTAISQKSL